MILKKGDLVAPVGALKEVVDFLASAEGEKLRLLRSFIEGGAPVEDAKLLQKPRKVGKVYKDTLEISLSATYLWEEKRDYFKGVLSATKRSKRSKDTVNAPDTQSEISINGSPGISGTDSGTVQSVVEQDSSVHISQEV